MYKTHPNVNRANTKKAKKNKKQTSTDNKRDEINIMNIINENTFNLNLLNNDNRYMKITQKSKLKGVSRQLISTDYREF